LDHALGELLDTLGNRLGPNRVVRAEPVASHLPERATCFRPAIEEGIRPGLFSFPDRPSLLLERPDPIEVIAMTPDGPPSWFRWRGQEQRITASAGPERLAVEWWKEKTNRDCSSGRDYFKIQDEHGRWLWIYRIRSRWFVHGLWA
jgi:protein ImuB